jgi:DNA-binding transcriptional ArsR family regulator
MSRIKYRMKGDVKTVARSRAVREAPPPADWTFFSNHAHVLFCLSGEPDMLLREVAARVGVTERAVQRIIAELEAAGVLSREREGRRNRYSINRDAPLRHPVEAHCSVGMLIDTVIGEA